MKPGGIEAGGERGGALFHSERFCLENPYVFAKVHPAQVELGRADFEFEHSSSKLELEEDLLGVGEPQGGDPRATRKKRIHSGQESKEVCPLVLLTVIEL